MEVAQIRVADWTLTGFRSSRGPRAAAGADHLSPQAAPAAESGHPYEVKGCTLEIDGLGYFPDAPTERGVKHLHELAKAVREGYECYIAFVIAMPGVTQVLPNRVMHPAFGEALDDAVKNGARILHLPCTVTPDGMAIQAP